jgi:cation/acetate symporter
VAWAFSIAAAGLFPALVMGVWWKRANSTGAVVGILAGFGVCLLYLVVTRYFPGFGVAYLGMDSLVSPTTGKPVVDLAKLMAEPNAMDGWVAASHPLQSKVGWMNVNNISSALFGLPAGFLGIIVGSLLTKAPSKAMMDFIDEIRRPKGKELMEGGNLVREIH